MRTRIFLLLFFAGVSLWGQEYRSIIDEVVEKYKMHQSMSYDIAYQIKTFDSDENWQIKTTVLQKRIQGDSVFGGKFLYNTQHEREDVEYRYTKYYNGENLFVIAHNDGAITRYDSASGHIHPITGAFDGEVIKAYFFDPERLLKVMDEEENTTSFSESPDYIVVKIQYPDYEEFYGHERSVFINKSTMLIDKVLFQAQYLDQIQNNSWEFSNVVFDTVSDETFESRVKEYFEDYTLEDYKPKTEDDFKLLAIEEVAPKFSGTLFPDYSTEVKLTFDKITILDFWFTTCHPCIKAIPHLNKIKDKYGDTVEVIGVNNVESTSAHKERIEAFLGRIPMGYPIFLTDQVPEAYNIMAYPTLYIIGTDGKVKYSQIAYSDDMFEELDEVIGKLILE